MGVHKDERRRRHKQNQSTGSCKDVSAPICECCTIHGVPQSDNKSSINNINAQEDTSSLIGPPADDTNPILDLVVIGAGPHALTLLLRLLEPEADLLSESERHARADFTRRMRSWKEVRSHIKRLGQGPAVVVSKRQQRRNRTSTTSPAIPLKKLRQSVLVLDKTPASSSTSPNGRGGWLSNWKQNFSTIQIPVLRSLMHAHADPYDHRALEAFAELKGRSDELVPLKYLTQRDSYFRGPYHAPSTKLFLDFHSLLARGYGIDDMVQCSVQVNKIIPKPGASADCVDPYFELEVSTDDPKTTLKQIKARRVVCAMGPAAVTEEAFWEADLRKQLGDSNYPSHRILHANEIVPWLLSREAQQHVPPVASPEPTSLLIIGGGVTSAQLALLASRKASWCHSVTLLQRSRTLHRQFDVENKWMGPLRGKLLDEYWSLEMKGRAAYMQEARGGGSIPPEVRSAIDASQSLTVKEEVQISGLEWHNERFYVTLDDGSAEDSFDMIWMATGFDIDFSLYPPLRHLQQHLPVETIHGMPVLDQNLSWKMSLEGSNEEPPWKSVLRRRLYVMGSLAGLELGPDALNLAGARHGAVRIAKALREDMNEASPGD